MFAFCPHASIVANCSGIIETHRHGRESGEDRPMFLYEMKKLVRKGSSQQKTIDAKIGRACIMSQFLENTSCQIRSINELASISIYDFNVSFKSSRRQAERLKG